jgi:hypothetical protein
LEHSLSEYRNQSIGRLSKYQNQDRNSRLPKRSAFISRQPLVKDFSRLSRKLNRNIGYNGSPKKTTMDHKSVSNMYINKRGKIHSRSEADGKGYQDECWLNQGHVIFGID